MYAITSYPFVKRTFATLRMAEFGFFGVRVMTCKQTPRRNGAFSRAGDLLLYFNLFRPFRTSWLIVGITPVKTGFITFPEPLEKRSANNTTRIPRCNKYLKKSSVHPLAAQGP